MSEQREVYVLLVAGYGQFFTDKKPRISGNSVTVTSPRKHSRIENVRTKTSKDCAELVSDELTFVGVPIMIKKTASVPGWFDQDKQVLLGRQPATLPPAGSPAAQGLPATSTGVPTEVSEVEDPAQLEADQYVRDIISGTPVE